MTKDELIKRTLEDLGKQYPVGLYEYLYECRREAYNAILWVEDKIDQTFLTGTVEGMKAALRDYWRLHMEAIKQFKQAGGIYPNQALTRQKIEEERVRA